MFKQKIFNIMVFLILLLAACAPLTATPSPIVTEEPAVPVTGVAVVESMEVQILESLPVQIRVILRGQLPDAGCTTIGSIEQIREGNIIRLILTTTTDPLALCAPALTPFEQVVPLDISGLTPGEYRVQVADLEQSVVLPAGDASQFESMLVDALNARDFEMLKELMGDSFMIGYWLSEGVSSTPEEAIEQLQQNLLHPSSPITADPDKDLVALLGVDPVTIVGPDVVEARPLFTSGWGPEGKDEAILFIAEQPDGALYWYGLLFAREGFGS